MITKSSKNFIGSKFYYMRINRNKFMLWKKHRTSSEFQAYEVVIEFTQRSCKIIGVCELFKFVCVIYK